MEDSELLMRVIDERFVSSQANTDSAEAAWKRFFVANVGTVPVRTYLASRILPRPRDILFLVKTAVATAVNRSHSQVVESDIREAEKQYSRYALDTIEAEATATFPNLGEVLLEFVGAKEVLERDEIERFMIAGGLVKERLGEAMDFLLNFGFLGIEVRFEEFKFAADENDLKKNLVLARKLQDGSGRQHRYKIHQAFHPYLEVGRTSKE